MRHFVVSARLKAGAEASVRAVLREGPPFDPSEASLDRHQVFMGDDELVFLFEGQHAEREAKRLLKKPGVLSRAGRIGVHLKERPRLPEEVFSWERPQPLDGVTFGPQAGPGDSEGSLSD
jgi:hypothetical protein